MKTNLLKSILVIILVFSSMSFVYTQTKTDSLTTGTNLNYTVPCGVTSLTVVMWGGGGGGGGDNTNGGNKGCGGGGGGYTSSVLAVSPGDIIVYSVGAGGTAGAAAGGAGGNGGNTRFGTLTDANGGTGGGGPAGAAGAGGTGGTFAGAAGIAGTGTGAGGRAGGSGGVGTGANGGTGVGASSTGLAGSIPGGGGSGGNDGSVAFNYAGGAGGRGVIRITYNITSAGADQTLAACETTATMAATAPGTGTGTWSCVSGCTGVGITTATSATSGITGLVPGTPTTLRWTVSNAGCTSTTDDVVITPVVGALCPIYCAEPTSNCASFNEGLVNVTFKTVNANSTTCANGVAATAIVTPGETFSFTATAGAGSSGNYSLAVYCDWNSNGTFGDAGEYTLVANDNMNGAGAIASANITVPAGATCGATIKLRVLYSFSSTPTSAQACTNFTYGETEDYYMTVSCCTPNCSNGIQDCNELGIDCGGPCGSACSGVVSCTNAIMDGDETGIDCGGPVCNPCGAQCSTFSNATSNPVIASDGTTVIDARTADQTIVTCVEVTYSNRGTNWLHGVFMNPGLDGFKSSNATGALPEPNASSVGTTYRWRNQTTDFDGDNSGTTITQNGWFVTTAAADDMPGNNLGWPVGAGTTFGPFCFSTVISCDGLNGDIAANMNFQTTGDSYSGSWTNTDCGKESSFGANAFHYTLQCPTVLPIEMLSFNGFYEGRSVLLKWSTASEQNNDYFVVLRSTDGLKFEELGKMEGAPDGSSITKRDYSFSDNSPANPMGYYKIRQVDFNGEKKESGVVAVMSPKLFDKMMIVPNPVENLASLTFNSTISEITNVKVYDYSGKLMFDKEIISENGLNTFTFETEDYKSGFYFLEISNNHDLEKIRFNVQK